MNIPIHRHYELPGNGIHLKIVKQEDANPRTILYAHRDDYYIFGIIVHGTLSCDIDFKRQTINEGEIQFILPGQVHRFVGGENYEGWMLMADSAFVDDRYKMIFDEASIKGVSPEITLTELNELKTLFTLTQEITARERDSSVTHHLASAFIGIIAGCYSRACLQKSDYNSRHTEIMLMFNSLLHKYISVSHSPSFYADKLHISPGYLNEVVRSVSGLSAGRYIRNEIVVRAKRMLYHTNMSVKGIAASLGFDDNAYFTRLFTKATGISPVQFRSKP